MQDRMSAMRGGINMEKRRGFRGFLTLLVTALLLAGFSVANAAETVLVLATGGSASMVGGIQLVVTLPAGVTPKDGLMSGSALSASGQGTGSLIVGNYTPATAVAPG